MTDAIRHRVGIDAPAGDVYQAIATAEGGRRWWTETVEVEGGEGVGGALTYVFGSPERSATMAPTELSPGRKVVWTCTAGPAEWIGTTIAFELQGDETGHETVVLFTHDGWREPVEFMHHCTTAWGYFLLSLKHDLEGGKGSPFPRNEKISGWDPR
jgi:uncharacterized protein YndB with AHSA1/START domain